MKAARGYSLIELLVVVTIIGIFSLVSVPAFLTYQRQAQIRTATRQLNADLRAARQRAISRNNPVALSWISGATPGGGFTAGQYALFDRVIDTSTDPDTITWVRSGSWRFLTKPVYFLDSDFATDSATDDSLHDIVFLANGTVANMPTGGGAVPAISIKTDSRVPNNRTTATFNASGFFSTVQTTE